MVEEVCQVYADLAAARSAVREHGLVRETPILNRSGAVVGSRLEANPAAALSKGLSEQLARLLKSLGLTAESLAKWTHVENGDDI